MAVQIKHAFVSLKGDGSDLTQVQPSNWNAAHLLTQATGKVLGRVTAGAGATEEIDWSAFGRSWLNAADANAAQGLLGPVSSIANQAVTYKKLQLASAAARLIGSNGNPALTILGAANNGAGLVRLQVANTSTFATGQRKVVAGVVGTTEANDSWIITVVDATHIDLQGSTFANTYVSGGTIGGGFEEISLGAGLRMTGSVLSTPAFPPLGAATRKSIIVTGNTGFSVSASAVAGDGTNYSTVTFSSPTVNVATNGGLDAMEGALTLAGPAWLSVWGICKADGSAPKILCNYSDTTITTFPAGYTQKILLGHLRVTSGNLLMGSHQKGDRFQYVMGLAQTTFLTMNMASGVAGAYDTAGAITWAAIPVGAFVPPTASEISVLAQNTWKQSAIAALVVAPNANYGARSNVSGNFPWIDLEANSQPPFVTAGHMMLESTNIYWACNGAGGAVHCTGFRENI
jgi:hypothetical protein